MNVIYIKSISLFTDPKANSGYRGLKIFSLLFTFTLRWHFKHKLLKQLDMQAWPTSIIRLINSASWWFFSCGYSKLLLLLIVFVLKVTDEHSKISYRPKFYTFEINNYSCWANRVCLCVCMHGRCKNSSLAYCSVAINGGGWNACGTNI